ncbi:sodium- and chloride-dependent GABA transporter 2-like [Tubulanus polymorphus]|uniref:sodium- and chloride-dependent GABA transporter 2-like n=1 Tax=Tubulanus polymorphus TaxID=672921 RepID=UPI003DA20757
MSRTFETFEYGTNITMGQGKNSVGAANGSTDPASKEAKRLAESEQRIIDQAVVENGTKDVSSDIPQRDQWSNKVEFILTCVGLAVGLGNVWRFPYLCYKNGGGAFLIPYAICLVCCSLPVFFLEVALGQFMSLGGWKAWRICPLFQGIGIASAVIVFFSNSYYAVIIAWALYYLSMSFSSVLPWTHCDNAWNTERCSVSKLSVNCSLMNGDLNVTCQNITNITALNTVDPVVEFWERKILKISPGVDQPGTVVWELAVALFVTWILCYFSIWKGIKWTGKVVYFTSLFPYLVITILTINGALLEGSLDGVIFYLKPDFSKLLDPGVWYDAGTQTFYSYAIGYGALTALGSYNKFNNNVYRQCILVAIINCSTSLYAGFAVFCALGFMAKQQGVPIQDVASSGPGLVFIAYPKSIGAMSVPQLWAVLFFIMILLLGMSSEFACCEGFVTTMSDFFPKLLRKSPNREIFTAVYFFASFLVGLSMITNGGMYVFQMFDYYSVSGFCLLWVCFFEVAAIAWVYGAKRFYDNIQMMIGYRMNPWFLICWMGLAPALMGGIFLFSAVKFKVLTYNHTYVYPEWAQAIGISLALISMIQIPLFLVYKLIRTPGSLRQRFATLIKPKLKAHQLRAQDKDDICILKRGPIEGSVTDSQTMYSTTTMT